MPSEMKQVVVVQAVVLLRICYNKAQEAGIWER